MAVTVKPDVSESDYEAQQNVDGAHVDCEQDQIIEVVTYPVEWECQNQFTEFP